MEDTELKEKIHKEVSFMFEGILNYCEVAVANEDQYFRLRRKILRLGNNCIRHLQEYVDKD